MSVGNMSDGICLRETGQAEKVKGNEWVDSRSGGNRTGEKQTHRTVRTANIMNFDNDLVFHWSKNSSSSASFVRKT